MRILEDVKLDFDDVLLLPKRSRLASRSEVALNRSFTFMYSGEVIDSVPVMAANMDTVGTLEMATALAEHKMHTALHKFYSIETLTEFFALPAASYSWYSMGITENDFEKFNATLKAGAAIKRVVMDVANGYQEVFVDAVRRVRKAHPSLTIMAGNVVSGEMTEALILAGADCVKVGIGPGSVCTTRKVTGVGYPQLSAIIECADAAHGLGGQVCGDGGCKVPGDVAKAFCAGADFVMLGGMLAGHDESAGELIERNGKKLKLYYGMSSEVAMTRHHGGVAKYRAPEGKAVEVPYRGPVLNTVQEILGGIRSAGTYIGARRLKEYSKRATFVRVSRQLNTVFGDS